MNTKELHTIYETIDKADNIKKPVLLENIESHGDGVYEATVTRTCRIRVFTKEDRAVEL